MNIFHVLDGSQGSGVFKRLLFLIREYSLISRQIVLRFVKPAQGFELYLTVLALDTKKAGFSHILLFTVHFLADWKSL